MNRKLPVMYDEINARERKAVREQYIKEQNGRCMFCNNKLTEDPPEPIKKSWIDWGLFPTGFLKSPVHLQHNHDTGMTEGAVHNYCNAVLWQYHGE